MMRCEAMAMVCRPEEQKRLTVAPDTVTGRSAISAIWRAMLAPVAPSALAQPMSTSSTASPGTPARCSAFLTAWPPSVAPCVMLNAPFQLLVRGVRAVETMTALVMVDCLSGTDSGSGSRRVQVAQQLVVEAHELAEVGHGDALVGAVQPGQVLRLGAHRREPVDVVGQPGEVVRVGTGDIE